MIGAIEAYMTADHARLDALLRSAQRDDGTVDERVWAEFKSGLLRHIAIEEKILLPLARGAPMREAEKIHADHARIVKLLARAPTAAFLDEVRRELAVHNAIEEGDDGLYATSDALAGPEVESVIARMREVKTR